MSRNRILLRGLLTAVTLLSAACASASPWDRHERAVQLKEAAADPARTCDVEVLNATDRLLDTSVVLDGAARRLGLVTAGQSVTFPVACALRRVTALGVSQDIGMSEGRTFRRAAALDLLRATRVRLTQADEVRW
jgi:hypothetical protein